MELCRERAHGRSLDTRLCEQSQTARATRRQLTDTVSSTTVLQPAALSAGGFNSVSFLPRLPLLEREREIERERQRERKRERHRERERERERAAVTRAWVLYDWASAVTAGHPVSSNSRNCTEIVSLLLLLPLHPQGRQRWRGLSGSVSTSLPSTA